MKQDTFSCNDCSEISLIKKDIQFLTDTITELKVDMKFLSKLIFMINGGAIILGFLLK